MRRRSTHLWGRTADGGIGDRDASSPKAVRSANYAFDVTPARLRHRPDHRARHRGGLARRAGQALPGAGGKLRMAMGPYRLKATALWLLAAGAVCALNLPAQACVSARSYSFSSERPFSEHYLQDAGVVFRGRPTGYRNPDPEDPTDFFVSTEITFEVQETYLGEEREVWTALWLRTVYDPDSLKGFRNEAGDDLVVVVDVPSANTNLEAQLPQIRLGILCDQPGMSRFSTMEPILRKKGLID